jgi:hypothetical protein
MRFGPRLRLSSISGANHGVLDLGEPYTLAQEIGLAGGAATRPIRDNALLPAHAMVSSLECKQWRVAARHVR